MLGVVREELREIRNFIAGVALGLFLALLGIGLYQESQTLPPAFSCPPGLQIIIGNQVLLHSLNPSTRNCNIVPVP